MDKKQITGTTSSGFEFVIDAEVLDDMELIDDLAEAEEGDPLATSRAFTKILGKEQKQRLYKQLKEQEGPRVHVASFMREMSEILAARTDTKN